MDHNELLSHLIIALNSKCCFLIFVYIMYQKYVQMTIYDIDKIKDLSEEELDEKLKNIVR